MTQPRKDGGAAFPLQSIGPEFAPGYGGMSLRDWFAGQALPAVIAKCANDTPQRGETLEQMFARKANAVADEMLDARRTA
ncbi:MAG: hypothetical protein FKY71_08120 [Spiribacter salinus]|uniref:Uncharacterized protein n=1 Tax=Spiribacter salinus TaxID=1335746 RepID=A0A540VTR6_9GAMM|nr:MAG: hypothetical protein FKY71_08120 [Spiribacter salinus]